MVKITSKNVLDIYSFYVSYRKPLSIHIRTISKGRTKFGGAEAGIGLG
jgi:hypothetical protein